MREKAGEPPQEKRANEVDRKGGTDGIEGKDREEERTAKAKHTAEGTTKTDHEKFEKHGNKWY